MVLMSHLGRPKGEVVEDMSLDPVAFRLEELLNREVLFSDDCISEDAVNLSRQMLPREIHLLENLRFHPVIFCNNQYGTAMIVASSGGLLE